MTQYWPWWAGALALVATSIGFVLAVGRSLGVSTVVATLLGRDPPADVGARPLSRAACAAFVAGIVGGGAAAAASTGTLFAAVDPTFAALFGDGPVGLGVVFVGAVLVGYGTQLAGGCTSGHGLVGCARAQPGSLASTATFFGTGIAVSFLLDAVLR